MQVGDKVRVIDKERSQFGKIGKIVDFDKWAIEQFCVLFYGSGGYFRENELEVVK